MFAGFSATFLCKLGLFLRLRPHSQRSFVSATNASHKSLVSNLHSFEVYPSSRRSEKTSPKFRRLAINYYIPLILTCSPSAVDACGRQVYSEARLAFKSRKRRLDAKPDESSQRTHASPHFFCPRAHRRPAYPQP